MSRTTTTASDATSGFPPFAKVLKSREVEDPINLWIHRPFAYAFCYLVYRTPITPNQVTLISMLLGLAAAACWVYGTRTAMIWGGALLWISSIMDGADGILARARKVQSPFGRALDGCADMVVGLSTVVAGIYHLVSQGASSTLLLLGLIATFATVVQLNLYDFYKELYMRITRIRRGGEGDTAAEAQRLKQIAQKRKSSWYTRLSIGIYANYLSFQENLIRATNPDALGLLTAGEHSSARVETYRTLNRLPMQFWTAVSLAPHTYLFAIFAMFDRIGVYIWLRVSLMSVLAVAGIIAQRHATARTLEAFSLRARS